MPSLPIRQDLSAAELRTLACKEGDARVSRRLLAIAMALDGISRAEAARQAGMDRQTLRDWVTRYNAGGVDGLRDRDGSAPPADTNGHHKSVLNGFGITGSKAQVLGLGRIVRAAEDVFEDIVD